MTATTAHTRVVAVVLALAVAVAALVCASTPAHADPGDISAGMDSPFGGGGLDFTMSAGDGWNLLASSFSMAEIDPLSGTLASNDVSTAFTGDYSTVNDLTATNTLALNAAYTAQQTQQAQDQKNQAAAVSAADQTQVGPDGCPTSAPSNTLRDGSSNVGIAKLCADSVAKAPTPQAAAAIKFALNNLGVPYSQPQRNSSGYFDCSSFVTRAYTSAGVPLAPAGVNAPTTQTIAAAPWAAHIALSQVQPGDLIEPIPDHVVMALADGYMVHTNQTGDVSHVSKIYTSDYIAVRIDPSKA